MRKPGKTSVEQVNDAYLTPFHVMTHKNVSVTLCCCLTAATINRQRVWKDGPRRERETERKGGCDASSLPQEQLTDKNQTANALTPSLFWGLHVNPGLVGSRRLQLTQERK